MTDSRNSAQNFPIFTRVPSSTLTTKKSNLKLIKVNGIQELEANSPASKLDQAVVKFCELACDFLKIAICRSSCCAFCEILVTGSGTTGGPKDGRLIGFSNCPLK